LAKKSLDNYLYGNNYFKGINWNIKNADALKETMFYGKVDIVIANPPFIKNKYNYYVDFIDYSSKCLKKNGTMVCLLPLTAIDEIQNNRFKDLKVLKVLNFQGNHFFKGVGIEIALFVFKKTNRDSNKIYYQNFDFNDPQVFKNISEVSNYLFNNKSKSKFVKLQSLKPVQNKEAKLKHALATKDYYSFVKRIIFRKKLLDFNLFKNNNTFIEFNDSYEIEMDKIKTIGNFEKEISKMNILNTKLNSHISALDKNFILDKTLLKISSIDQIQASKKLYVSYAIDKGFKEHQILDFLNNLSIRGSANKKLFNFLNGITPKIKYLKQPKKIIKRVINDHRIKFTLSYTKNDEEFNFHYTQFKSLLALIRHIAANVVGNEFFIKNSFKRSFKNSGAGPSFKMINGVLTQLAPTNTKTNVRHLRKVLTAFNVQDLNIKIL